jgi:hypothetical protein
MAKDKLPALQFYTGDWRKDPGVQALDHELKGIWIDLLCMMHESPERGRLVLPNGCSFPDEGIARNLGLSEATWKQKRSTLLAYGVASEDEHGVLYNRRMVRDERIRHARARAGAIGGKAKRTQNDESKTESKRGSSVSSSSSIKKKHVHFDEEFEVFWEHYPRKTNKQSALKAYRARRREGIPADDLIAGRDRYRAYLQANGTEEKFTKLGSTFLGPDKHWLEPYHLNGPKPTPHEGPPLQRFSKADPYDPYHGEEPPPDAGLWRFNKDADA